MVLFTAYLVRESRSLVTTNMVSLSGFCGWSYERLGYHFTRRGKDFYMDGEVIIIKSYEFIKGNQRFKK